MTTHKEGLMSILIANGLVIGCAIGAYFTSGIPSIIFGILFGGFFILLLLIIWFFRMPERVSTEENGVLLCPADGKVVVIESTHESEYFKEDRIQISIFMSPLNVHAQWYPCSGDVTYTQYHKGKYLVAWHPKSSTLNERSTVVVKNKQGIEVLIRQIAGAVARRIVTYSKTGDEVALNQELGFIKFGSRVDIFLPKTAQILVELDQKVIGNQTILAKL